MPANWFETAIIVFIMLGMGVAIWKGGMANPEGTGALGRKFDSDIDALRKEMKRIEKAAATSKDIERLETAIADVKAEVSELGTSAASREATLDHVKQQVDRLYDFIVNRGMSK